MSFSFDADAQYRGKKKKKKKSSDTKSEYFDESGDFKSKLWFGADVSLNFGQSSIGSGYVGNTIVFGLTPMVAYKFTDNFSAGPKIGFLYQGGRYNNSAFGDDLRLNATDFTVGIFSRYKILQYYFVQGEVENIWESFATGVIGADNRIELEREATLHYYLGAGYGSGSGALGFNAYALWDFSQKFTASNLPVVIRLGLTYKF